MIPKKQASRQKILKAAAEITNEVGPKRLSLDAVAARAGLSKGGLLYNFPSKSKLLEALVSGYLTEFNDSLQAQEQQFSGRPNACALAFLEVFKNRILCEDSKPSGVLAAIAEDPSFIAPIRAYNSKLVERLRADATDPELALIAFLVVEGMRSMKLLDIDVLAEGEHLAVFERLTRAMERE
ncbi:MAG: TetR/AcrR family transcriptional regulator [Phyllobacterium sp.]